MRTLLLIFLVLGAWLGYAQPDLEIVRNLRKRDGLSSDQVSCMVRDSLGFLWIGTWSGLNRFDGVTFRNYYTGSDDAYGLPNNVIYDLLLTRSGLLLVATGDGMAVIKTNTGRFENHRVEHPEIRAGSGHAIHGLYQDPEGRVWVNHDGEFDILSEDLRFLYRFSDLPWATGLKRASSNYEDWQMDTRGRLWIPTDTSGLQIVDFGAQVVYNRKHNPDRLPYLEYQHIRSFLMNEDSDRLWLGPWGGGLLGFSLGTGTLEAEPLAGYPVVEGRSVNMIYQGDGELLVFSWMNALYQYDPVSGQMEQLLFAGDQVLSAFPIDVSLNAYCSLDHEQVFLGSLNRGLLYVRNSRIQPRRDLGGAVGESQIFRLFDLRDIGYCALTRDGSILALDTNDLRLVNRFRPPVPQKSHMEAASDGRKIWIASLEGFKVFDGKKSTFLQVPVALDTFRGWLISALQVDAQEGLWIATREPASLWRLHLPTGRLDRIAEANVLPLISHGHQSRIDQIEQDENGILWFTSMTSNVIASFDPRSAKWNLHPRDDEGISFFPGEGVQSMKPLAGKIWVTTTSGDGLIAYDPVTGLLDVFSKHRGIPSNRMQIMSSWANSELWLLTESDVIVFDPFRQRIQDQWALGVEDDLSLPYWPAALVTPQGAILASGSRLGFLRKPDADRDTLFPAVILDAMSVNNRELLFDAQSDTVELSSPDRNVSLDFVLPDLAGGIPWELSYRLLGLDTNWILAGSLRRVTYTHLRPGLYTFEARVAHPYTDRTVIHRLISFRIVPPLWQRWWFVTLALALLSGVFIWMARWRIGAIRKAAALKLEMTELEMKALQAQMNPHFIFNCLNSIDALVHNNEKHLATQFLNKFARLLRSVLDSSRQNVVPIAKDIDTLRLYVELEQFRHDNRFDVAWEIDPQLLHGDFQVPPLVVQPFVENAILHGLGPRQKPGGMLRIGISLAGDVVRYVIEDNGVGRSLQQGADSPRRESHGIRMTLDRIRLFNREEEPSVTFADLDNEGYPAGTRVEVMLHLR